MTEPRPESRLERKERTRRAILDAALELCEDSSLVALSLRQVAGRVGIVPTGFYRHFDSIEALGMALVDESFASLRAMLRDVRRMDRDFTGSVHAMVSTAESLIAAADRPALETQIAETARTQLRMVIIGALGWRSRTEETPGESSEETPSGA